MNVYVEYYVNSSILCVKCNRCRSNSDCDAGIRVNAEAVAVYLNVLVDVKSRGELDVLNKNNLAAHVNSLLKSCVVNAVDLCLGRNVVYSNVLRNCNCTCIDVKLTDLTTVKHGLTTGLKKIDLTTVHNEVYLLINDECTGNNTVIHLTGTNCDAGEGRQIVIPMIQINCCIIIGVAIIIYCNVFNCKVSIYTNGYRTVCGNSTVTGNGKSLVDAYEYKGITTVVVISACRSNAVIIKIKSEATFGLTIVGGINVYVLLCLDVYKKLNDVSISRCIKCLLKSCVICIADASLGVAVTNITTGDFNATLLNYKIFDFTAIDRSVTTVFKKIDLTAVHNEVYLLINDECTGNNTVIHLTGTNCDAGEGRQIVIPMIQINCCIIIGVAIIIYCNVFNCKVSIYTNGYRTVCGNSTVTGNGKSLVDAYEYKGITTVVVISACRSNAVIIKIKSEATFGLTIVSGVNVYVLLCLDVYKKLNDVTIGCRIKCLLKSLIVLVADLSYNALNNDAVFIKVVVYILAVCKLNASGEAGHISLNKSNLYAIEISNVDNDLTAAGNCVCNNLRIGIKMNCAVICKSYTVCGRKLNSIEYIGYILCNGAVRNDYHYVACLSYFHSLCESLVILIANLCCSLCATASVTKLVVSELMSKSSAGVVSTLTAGGRLCTSTICPVVIGNFFLATNITVVVLVACCVRAILKNFATAIVTNVILIICAICVLSDLFGTTVITNVILAFVYVLAVIFSTATFSACAIIAVVILVFVCTLTDLFGTTVITNVVLVFVYMLAVGLATAVVTCVILICIFTSAEVASATVVALMVLVSIGVLTKVLATTVVTLVIIICICASADCFLATVVTCVVLVFVCVIAVGLIATIVTLVIIICIFTSADCFLATVITLVILAFVYMLAVGLATTIVTLVIVICVFTSADCYLTTIVTYVIGIRILVLTMNNLTSCVITNVILILIYAIADCYVTTVVTYVILICILMLADCYLTTIVTYVIGIRILVLTMNNLTSCVITNVILILIYAIADCYVTTVVTYVILICILMLADCYLTTIVTYVIGIRILVLAVIFSTATFSACAIIAVVILIGICTSAEVASATVVALMILVSIVVLTEVLFTAVVTLVIKILILASTDCFLTTVVTCVVLVFVYMLAVGLTTAVVTIVIKILILTSAYCFLTTIVTCVIGIGILVITVGLIATVITVMIKILILASADCYLTTIITNVIGIGILVIAVGLIATMVTLVIKILILTSAYCFLTTVITCVILIFVYVIAVGLIATVITVMIKILILASADCYLTTVITCVVLVFVYMLAVGLATAVVALVILNVYVLTNTYCATTDVTNVILCCISMIVACLYVVFVIFPKHVVADAIMPATLDIRSLIQYSATVILSTVENNTGSMVRNLYLIVVVSSVIESGSNFSAGPRCIFTAALSVPIVNVNVRPLPIVLEIDNNSIFVINMSTSGTLSCFVVMFNYDLKVLLAGFYLISIKVRTTSTAIIVLLHTGIIAFSFSSLNKLAVSVTCRNGNNILASIKVVSVKACSIYLATGSYASCGGRIFEYNVTVLGNRLVATSKCTYARCNTGPYAVNLGPIIIYLIKVMMACLCSITLGTNLIFKCVSLRFNKSITQFAVATVVVVVNLGPLIFVHGIANVEALCSRFTTKTRHIILYTMLAVCTTNVVFFIHYGLVEITCCYVFLTTYIAVMINVVRIIITIVNLLSTAITIVVLIRIGIVMKRIFFNIIFIIPNHAVNIARFEIFFYIRSLIKVTAIIIFNSIKEESINICRNNRHINVITISCNMINS